MTVWSKSTFLSSSECSRGFGVRKYIAMLATKIILQPLQYLVFFKKKQPWSCMNKLNSVLSILSVPSFNFSVNLEKVNSKGLKVTR